MRHLKAIKIKKYISEHWLNVVGFWMKNGWALGKKCIRYHRVEHALSFRATRYPNTE